MDNVLNENEKIINNIKASMSFEGMNLDKSDIDLINSFLDNKITEQEGIEIIKNEFKNM
ncbi:MAG: antitoxin VbhA family protein [Christensenellales bacterium]|nr:unknown [Clostridium sp. CAG:465]